MAKRGPKRIPTITLRNRGSWRASGRQSEPRLPVEAPEPPETLAGEARAEWDRIVPRLIDAGVITAVDRAILVAYCETWAEYNAVWKSCLDDKGDYEPVIKTDKGNRVQNPATGLRNKLRHQLKDLAGCLGITPADRSSVKAAPKAEPEDAKKRLWRGA